MAARPGDALRFTAVEGSNSVQVRQTDVAGNTGPASAAFTFTLDTTSPAAPGVSLASDTGTSGSDHITNNGALTLTGLESGATVAYSTNGGTTWTLRSPRSRAQNSVQVRQTDVAGNTGPASAAFTFTLDTAPGGARSLAGERHRNVGQRPHHQQPRADAVRPREWREVGTRPMAARPGRQRTEIAQLVQGANTVEVRQTDVAGNVPGLGGFTFTLDTIVPSGPRGRTDERHRLIEQRSHHQQSGADTDQHRGGGQGRVLARRRRHLVDHAPTATQLVQGANTIDVRQTDVAGNISGVAAVTFTLDTVPPTIAITTPIAGDNIVNAAEAAAGFAINGTTSGVADGQTATIVLVNSANAVLDTYTPIVSGNAWSITVTSTQAQALANGSYTLKADVSDVAGNAASEASQALTVNKAALSIAITTPIASDNIVNAAEAAAGFSIQGTTTGVADGQIATITIVNSANTVLFTFNPVVSGNAWSVTVPGSDHLPDGSYTIKADVSDGVGNQAPEASQALTVDETDDHWTGGAGGNWATASNWASGVPTSTMTARLDFPGTYTVTSSSNVTINGLSSIPTVTLSIQGGTFTVANFAGQGPVILSGGTFDIGSSTANVLSFTQSGGELNGTGTLTVTGTGPVPASNFSAGTQSGSGTTIAQNGATFSSTGFGLDGGRTLQLGGASTTSGASRPDQSEQRQPEYRRERPGFRHADDLERGDVHRSDDGRAERLLPPPTAAATPGRRRW